MSAAVKKVIPLLDRVLVKRAEGATQTASGIVIPDMAQSKVLHGEVVAVGTGARKANGDFFPVLVKVGDKVVLPEHGGTKVTLENDEREYHLFRESDILAKIDDPYAT
ncbi:10 kDa heat shock protein, mitochondrial-like [Plodia interpunctella]|uniref:10 kDa heat shock protein, mitochondrial-like n=1 Tax=Plodia interpunctella TaxID=58824 RepID=UPI002368DE5D|nr:10 kDa heat shock protein, mitochondrial-like [Plodia interpunctella]